MIELTNREVERASELFAEFPFDRCWIRAAIDRRRGRLYTESEDRLCSAILWPERGCVSFAVGDPLGAGAARVVAEYLIEARVDPPPIWFLSVANDVWKQMIIDRFEEEFLPIKRVTFAHAPAGPTNISGWESEVPAGFEIRRVDMELAARIPTEIDADFNLFWESPKEFVDMGLGYCLIGSGRLLSVASIPFPAARQAAIGVATAPDCQGMGYSTITSRALIEECFARGIEPNWTTGAENVAARSVARKLGFADERFHWWLLHT